jgi:hypothetical protein
MRLMAQRTAAALFAVAVIAAPVAGQSDTQHFLLAGYGTGGYNRMLGGGSANNFSATISPIFLYSSGDFLFEAEMELELEEVATETDLEYAQLDYEGLDNFQFVVGKFLLPFGIFGERLHPTWINKLPVMTPLFAHAHEGVPFNSLFPVLSDVGAMARWSAPVGEAGWYLNASAYVTQGPGLADSDAAEEAAGEPGYIDVPAPQMAWGVNYTDNNTDKMVGGRVGVVKGPYFEGYVSALKATYDPDHPSYDVWATALSLQGRYKGLQVLAEGTLLAQDFEDAGAAKTQKRKAMYAEASERVGDFEGVVRWGYIADATVDGDSVSGHRTTVTTGVDYWFTPTIPLKAALVFQKGMKTRLAVQWAFGF